MLLIMGKNSENTLIKMTEISTEFIGVMQLIDVVQGVNLEKVCYDMI